MGSGAERPVGGAGRPHMVAPRGLFRWRASFSLLESSHDVHAISCLSLLEGLDRMECLRSSSMLCLSLASDFLTEPKTS